MKDLLKNPFVVIAIVTIALIAIWYFFIRKSDGLVGRKFHWGGALGYGGWFTPSTILVQPTPPINEDTQSIYRISCEPAYFDGVKWNAKCNYPGLTGNFYETIGCADTKEGAIEKAMYQIQNNAKITVSRPIPERIPGRPVN